MISEIIRYLIATGKRKNNAFIICCIFLTGVLITNANAQQNAISTENIVDLTHTLDDKFPYIPIPGITFPFSKIPIATIKTMGVAANRWEIHEHIGTQIDAPSHFSGEGMSLEKIPVRNLIAPLAVIDISERAAGNKDTSVTIEDIKNWEKKYGRLPTRAAVFMYSGWDVKVKDPEAFISADKEKTMHFPGFSPESVAFLLRERDVVGIGVDTISIDPGKDKTFQTHKTWLVADKWAVECVANLRQTPPAGATVFVGATKVGGATGGPVRLIATFPSAISMDKNRLTGKWKSVAGESFGGLGIMTREFDFRAENWSVKVTFFSDKEMTKPLFSFDGEGKYSVGETSKMLPATSEAVFYFDKKSLTFLTDDMNVIKTFRFDTCNLTKYVPKILSEKGCSSFTSVAACGQEFDLVNFDGEMLRLGSRPSAGDNICSIEKRPKTLGLPLARVN